MLFIQSMVVDLNIFHLQDLQQLSTKNTLFEVKVTQNVSQYPSHQVAYVPVKFVVTSSNRLGGYAST